MPKLNNIPGEPQVWKDSTTGKSYLVYFVPGLEPPVPLLYEATDKELQAAFGPGKSIKYDRTLSNADLRKAGAMEWGVRSELTNETEDPFESWVTAVNDQAEVRPWLRDNEVLALMAEAMLEGRAVSDAEFQQTEWWQSRNEAQRRWMLLVESDPATANQMRREQNILVQDMLRAAGMAQPPADLIRAMSNLYLTGDWGEAYLKRQITAITDPQSGYKVDSALADFVGDVGTTRDQESEVRQLVSQWLGPMFGGRWNDNQIARWAGRFRNDPNAREEFEDLMRRQRLALFPEYDNPNLTYEDIAGPWRGLVESTWGEIPDETSTLFTRIVRMNDSDEAEKLLRKVGLQQGKGKVVQTFSDQLGATGLGSRVRQVV